MFSLSSLSLVGYGIGFLNQVLIANRFGSSAELDLYLIALSVVNIGWFFSGPISEVTIPQFFDKAKLNISSGSLYFSQILNNIFIFSFLSSCMIYTLLPFIFYHINSENVFSYVVFEDVVVSLVPIILLCAVNHFFQGVLNSLSVFIAQSVGKIITAIISMIILIMYFDLLGIQAIIYGLEVGLFTFVIIQFILIRRLGVKYVLFTSPFLGKRFYKATGALSLTYFGTALLPVFEKIIFLIFGIGFISSYNYAFLLLQVALQVISAGVIAVAWTSFMESLRNNNNDSALDGLYNLSLNAFIVSFFVAMFIFFSSKEFVYIVFYSGNFDEDSLYLTSKLLKLLIWSLPFFIVNALLSRALVTINGVRAVVVGNLISILFTFTLLFLAYQYESYIFAVTVPVIIQILLAIYYISQYRNSYKNKNIFHIKFVKTFVSLILIILFFGGFSLLFEMNIFILGKPKSELLIFLIYSSLIYIASAFIVIAIKNKLTSRVIF